MKTRNGFVSNSSSSSFVIAAKPEKPIKINIEVDITEYSEDIIKTLDDVKNYIEEYWGDVSENLDDYNKMKSEIDKGNWIYVGSFSNENGDGIETYLCYNGIKQPTDNSFTVIQSDAGY